MRLKWLHAEVETHPPGRANFNAPISPEPEFTRRMDEEEESLYDRQPPG